MSTVPGSRRGLARRGLGDCAAAIVRAHRQGMRVALVVQRGWSGLLRASLAQLGVLVAHLDQSGVHGAWSTIARGGRVCCHLLG